MNVTDGISRGEFALYEPTTAYYLYKLRSFSIEKLPQIAPGYMDTFLLENIQ